MLKSGHRVLASSLKEYEKVYEDFVGHRVGTVRLQPGNWFFAAPFINDADKIFDFKFRPSDVLVVTYPKCGTTWTQEIVWTIMKNPNLDNPKAAIDVNFRCPFLEFDHLMAHFGLPLIEPGERLYDGFRSMHPDKNPEDGIFLQLAEVVEEPRTFKTHLPLSLLAPSLLETSKVIYVARNPKDVAVSYQHHCKFLKNHNYLGSLDSFVDHLINDRLIYSPYWTHVKEGWKERNHPNLLFLYYEDMKEDPKKKISKIAKFLNVELTDVQLNNVVKHTSFNAMKERSQIKPKDDVKEDPHFNTEVFKTDGGFFRKGEANDWKNKLSEEHVQTLDKWTKTNCQDLEDDFKYKI